MLIDREKLKFQVITYQQKLLDIVKAVSELERNHISPILIKGAAAASYYPEPYLRACSDIDLAVSSNDFETSQTLFKDGKYNVDLHRELRHLDVVEWNELFNNSQFITINNTKIRVLRREDHLRVLCVHWLNDGGADRTRLWDIYFAINTNPCEFDWERFFGPANEKRRRWLEIALLSAVAFLGLQIPSAKFETENTVLPDWIVQALENEWKNDNRLAPLHHSIHDKKEFIRQIRKRIPPNPIQAIIETDGEIHSSNQFSTQLKNFMLRTKPSVKRFLKLDGTK